SRQAAVRNDFANSAVEGVVLVSPDQCRRAAGVFVDTLQAVQGVPLVGTDAVVQEVAVLVIAERHIPATIIHGRNLIQAVVLAKFVDFAATDRCVHGVVPVAQAVQVVGSLL